MPKGSKYSDHERVEELEKWQRQKEIDDAIIKWKFKWVRTICTTATTAILLTLSSTGSFLYHHSRAIQAAVKAFLLADQGEP